jgi:hypothetical protein
VTECVAVVVACLAVATTWPLVAICALVEGILLGLLQGWLLHGLRVALVLRWTLATAAGLLIGRCIEYGADISPLAAAILEQPLLVQIFGGVALGAAVGAASGSFQALLLRDRMDQPQQWIVVCSIAWAVALPVLLAAGSVVAGLSAVAPWQGALAVVSIFTGIGALTGSIEGAGLARLLRRAGQNTAGTQRSSMPRRSASLTGFGR